MGEQQRGDGPEQWIGLRITRRSVDGQEVAAEPVGDDDRGDDRGDDEGGDDDQGGDPHLRIVRRPFVEPLG